MGTSARVLADSIGPNGVRLTSLEVTLPRIVLAELLTHRVFSRNSASSRAIPVERMIQKVLTDPFIPETWGANQKGMQAERNVDEGRAQEARLRWLVARDHAVTEATKLLSLGIHKQLANRLLEPFLWTTVLITATEWDNFFALRRHSDAQPEIQRVAGVMMEAREGSRPERKLEGEWHRPLSEDMEDLKFDGYTDDQINRIIVGRCARVSYNTHDGKKDPKADLALANRLLESGHMSPFEHVARASLDMGWFGNFYGWNQLRKDIPSEDVFQP